MQVFVLAVALFAAVCAALSFLAPVTFAHVPAIATRAVRFRVFAIFNLFVSCSLYLERGGAAKFLAGLSKASRQAISQLRLAFRTWLRSESPLHLIIFASVLTIAVGVRLTYLFEPIRYDEAFTYLTYARHPLWDAISNYSYPNNHLFHTALVHICVRLFGGSEWVLRLPVVPVLIIYSSAGVCILLRFVTRSLRVVPETLVPVASLVCSVLLTFSVMRSAVILRLDDLVGLRRANEVVGFLHSLGPGQEIIAMAPCDAPLEYYAKRQGQTFFWTDFGTHAFHNG
jgi:hypothetical protein